MLIVIHGGLTSVTMLIGAFYNHPSYLVEMILEVTPTIPKLSLKCGDFYIL